MDSVQIEFVGDQSYHYHSSNNGREIDFHLHIGKFNKDYLHIVIRDYGILITKDVKALKYIDSVMCDFNMKIYDLFGYLKKNGDEREVSISVSFNSTKINYPPFIYFDDGYEGLFNCLSKDIFNKIKELNKKMIY